jgi:uncharacterized membrane protein
VPFLRTTPVHGFMLWNLALAMLPSLLAVVLFRTRARRGLTWWLGAVAWVLFLPNAPYVLTDVMHMVDDIRSTSSRGHAYVSLLVYGGFFAAGLASYVFSLQLCRRFLHEIWPARVVLPALVWLHGVCVIAMYIGRVLRFNSWDAVLAPTELAHAVVRVPRPTTIAAMTVTFVVVGVGAVAMAAVAQQAVAQARRLLR